MSNKSPKIRTSSSFYFILAFGWSLIFWTLTVVLGGINQFPGSILQYFGGAGPVVAALIIVHLFEAAEYRRDFWSRTFDIRRIPWKFLLAALLTHPIILFAAIGIELLMGGELQAQTNNLTNLGEIIGLVIVVFVFGPLPEEMGWRGIGYERLVQKKNPLMASLLLGIAWAAWHIPLFLIEGTFQNGLGFGSFRFWVFLLSNIPLVVIMTWIYNHTERSILAVVFVHFSGNIIGAIVTKSDRLAFVELIILIIVAFVLVVRTSVLLGHHDED